MVVINDFFGFEWWFEIITLFIKIPWTSVYFTKWFYNLIIFSNNFIISIGIETDESFLLLLHWRFGNNWDHWNVGMVKVKKSFAILNDLWVNNLFKQVSKINDF